MSLADSGPSVFLVSLRVLGSGAGAWGEVPLGDSGDSYSPLFPASRRTVYIKLKSNNNSVGVGDCSLARSFAFYAILGLLLRLRGSLVIVWGLPGLGLSGGFWCQSDLISRRNNKQCVQQKICNSS